jgi:hypothetical protein
MRPYYDQDGVTIYHGDCLDVLPTLGQVNHVITDPPYDKWTHVGARTSKGGSIRPLGIDFAPVGSDVEWFLLPCLSLAHRWVIVFCALEQLGAYQSSAPDAYVRSGVFRRHSGPQFSGDRPAQGAEGLAILHRPGQKKWNGGGVAAVWECSKETQTRLHPTPKPEKLMADLVMQFTDPGETILDPFMGSGTTLVAAKRLGRKAIGIEREEKYCEIAAKRLAQGALPLEFSA